MHKQGSDRKAFHSEQKELFGMRCEHHHGVLWSAVWLVSLDYRVHCMMRWEEKACDPTFENT